LSTQAIKAGDVPTLLINVKGKGRASVNVVATPWLAYGCSVGARLKTSFGCATVVEVPWIAIDCNLLLMIATDCH
jgi:hypothetical protein